MLERHAPKMRIGSRNVLSDIAETGRRQNLRAAASGQRPGIVECDRQERYIARRRQRHHRVIRWILDHVEGDVAKVALIGNAITGAKGRLAVTKNVPREPEPWSKVVLVRFP